MKELIYPSTYHAMKAGPCRVGVCKHDGECGKCEEYGTIRRYAARDTDSIQELRALVKEMEDEKRISDAVIKSLRDKKLEMAGEIADKDEEIARLRALVNGLADVVSTARPKFCNGCPAVLCTISGKLCGFVRNADELVAKDREVVQ